MCDKYELRRERDEALVWAFTDEAGRLKDQYQEWITSESKDLIIQCDLILPGLQGIMANRMRTHLRNLRRLQRKCDQSCLYVRERCQELRKGEWNDILEDHTYLQDHLLTLHSMVREIYDLRRVLDNLENPAESTQPPEDPPQ